MGNSSVSIADYNATISPKDEEIGGLQLRLVFYQELFTFLEIRSRIGELEKRFLSRQDNAQPRQTKWEYILISMEPRFVNNPEIMQFRSLFTAVETTMFINMVPQLYSMCSSLAAHEVRIPSTAHDTNSVQQFLLRAGIMPDSGKVKAISRLLEFRP